MEDFDAVSVLHAVVEEYMHERGTLPKAVRVSRELYSWFDHISDEERMLKGMELTQLPHGFVSTEYGNIRLRVDDHLSNFDIIPQ